MTTVYLEPDATLKAIAQAAFPNYAGKKFKVLAATDYHCQNYWSGGSKKSFVLMKREGMEVISPPFATTNPMNSVAHTTFAIPPGCVVVEHYIASGKDMGICFVVRPDEMDSQMLPAQEDLTIDQKIVLIATRTFKSSYGGIKNYRFSEASQVTRITIDRWEAAKAQLIESGHLNKQGAITPKGRNAAGNDDLYAYREK